MIIKKANGLQTFANHSELVNPREPNLLREQFPYTEVPAIVFDGMSVPMDPVEDYYITDTTFRDGQQARPPYTAGEIVKLYDFLSQIGGPNGIIRFSEFFLYSDKDKDAVNKCLELGHKFPVVTGWIRATKKDFEIVKQMGLKETGILTSCSDYHIYLKLKKDRAQVKEQYISLVRDAFDFGLDAVRCHLEDITRADFEGFVIPYVTELMKVAKEAGREVKIRLCDTMGYGVPWAEAALPRSVPKMIYTLKNECGVPGKWLEWHGHNDFHKVGVNGTTAWLYGAAAVNASLFGFGERTGNPSLEGAIFDYISLKGSDCGINTRMITEVAKYYTEELGLTIPDNYPFVGSNFNVTSAGVHADGILKNEEIYNIFDTAKILNRPARVNVTDKSGLAGIAHWVNAFLGLKSEYAIDKKHPGLYKINEWVHEQYKAGRVTSISDTEMLAQARIYLPDYFKSDFDIIKNRALDLTEKIIEEIVEDPCTQKMNVSGIEAKLSNIVRKHDFIQFAYVTDSKGIRITQNINPSQLNEKYVSATGSENFSEREWFVEAKKNKGIYITDFYTSRYTGEMCITVSAPIYNDDDDFIGVVGIDIQFEALARMPLIND
ncbi:MAG: histone-lysine N-methyltransferase [Abditibacteriota bacterium]|nr:histone-lysine N-methyltransferase [Abditibacteriota bacterium]